MKLSSNLKRRKIRRISFLFKIFSTRCKILLLAEMDITGLLFAIFIPRVNQHNDQSFFFSQTGQTVIHIIKLSRVCSRLQIPGFPLTVDYYLTKIPLGFFWSELHI